MTNRSKHAGGGSMALSVIAPCYNEQDNVELLARRTLATFDRMGIEAELVLVDDGSADATWARIQASSAADSRVRGVRHEFNRGMERAWHTGLSAARGECVCLIDADLQNRPEDIETLYTAYTEVPGYDMIQAVRHPVHSARQRKTFSRALNGILNAVFRTRARDSKSGFILCRRDVLEAILRHRYAYRYYQSFLGVAATWRGYRIGEVDTAFDCRHAGTSFIRRPLMVSMHICWELVKFRYELSREPYRPGVCRHVWGDGPIEAAVLGLPEVTS